MMQRRTFLKMCGAGVLGSTGQYPIRWRIHSYLESRANNRTRPIFWQHGGPYARLRPGNPDFVSPSLAVRDGDLKLLINPDGTDARLFNLAKDPGENQNLLDKNPQIAAELWKKIRAWASSSGLDTKNITPIGPTQKKTT
jgi:hypothetical protein